MTEPVAPAQPAPATKPAPASPVNWGGLGITAWTLMGVVAVGMLVAGAPGWMALAWLLGSVVNYPLWLARRSR